MEGNTGQEIYWKDNGPQVDIYRIKRWTIHFTQNLESKQKGRYKT